MSNFTFFHNVFYAICIFKSLNSYISVVVCSFFEFWKVSKWCIREWVKKLLWYHKNAYLPTILKNILCLFLQDFLSLKVT